MSNKLQKKGFTHDSVDNKTVDWYTPKWIFDALDFPSLNASVGCAQPVYGVPLVLDCRARSATVGGLDVSRRLKSRGFPSVAPGGTLSVVLRTGGSGWVDCSVHDTFM